MIGLLGLALIVALVVVAVTGMTRRTAAVAGSDPGAAPPDRGRRTRSLDDDLGRWTAAGLVSAEAADAIRAYERLERPPARDRRPGRVPPVVEALGYLGGLLAIVGLVLLVAQYWADMATPGRLALSGGGASALLVAGALVPAASDPAFARLQSLLWVTSAAATALFAAVAARDALGGGHGAATTAIAAGAVAVHSGALWRRRADRVPSQLVCLAAAVVCGGAAVGAWTDVGPAGVVVWAMGVALLAAGVRRWLPNPPVVEVVGALATAVGAALTMGDWQAFGLVFAAASSLALLAVALVPAVRMTDAERIVVGVVGALAALQALPSALGYFAPDAGAATGAITCAAGAALVFIGARRLVHLSALVELFGAVAVIGGPAITATQWPDLAPLFGIAAAIGLLAGGALSDRPQLAVLGSLGMVVNVPWAIARFFPGEGRAPLLIMVSGALIVVLSVALSRMDFGRHRPV